MRKIYLSNEKLETALENWKKIISFKLETETISATEIVGRNTSKPIFAKISAPFFKASAMDGIAVIAETTKDASIDNPINLIHNKDFVFVDTGDEIKEPFDSVIMIEDIHETGENTVEIRDSVSSWHNVRAMGEDIVAGELILKSGTIVSPEDIGAVLAGGVTFVEVYKKLKVVIIPTGDEIVSPGEPMNSNSIIDSNSYMLKALAEKENCIVIRVAPIKDDYEKLKSIIKDSVLNNDIVIINAGSSAGREDFTSEIINELGTVSNHGIAIKPGKPTVLGSISGKPVIGTPGYPVAAYTVFEKLILPIIKYFKNNNYSSKVKTKAVISKKMVSSLKHEEYIPVMLGEVQGKIIAAPINRGAGITLSLARADGFITIPQNLEGINSGTNVEVLLKNPNINPSKTIFSVGSHDLLIDIMGEYLGRVSEYRLVSTNVGSQGGLMALKRSECHISPTHLLDPLSGEYNLSETKTLFPNEKMILVKLFKRTQGLMVTKGNPKNIKSITDIVNLNLQIVNRQRGSGTRVLFDYLLDKNNIDVKNIKGYEIEVGTHMAVGAGILSGSADIGLGVYSAAKALNLDFIPIGSEDYDILMKKETFESELFSELIKIINNNDFKNEVLSLGGYESPDLGKIIEIGD